MNKITKALITGPTGVVGISLIEELLKNDIEVFAICRKNSPREQKIIKHPKVHIIECDLKDLFFLPSLVKSDIDVFYHFAWDGTFGESRLDCYRQLENVKFTLNAVEVAKKLNCKIFIGSGSQAEFGIVDKLKTQDTVCNPISMYGAAKLSSLHMAKIHAKTLGLSFCWTRIVSTFGLNDRNETIISYALNNMLENKECNFSKAEQVWDFIYSKDLAKAYRLIAQKGKDGRLYILASGKPRILKDYILSIADITKTKSKLNFGAIPYYKDQAMNLSCDISPLTNEIGFSCDFTFEQAIKDMIKNKGALQKLNLD